MTSSPSSNLPVTRHHVIKSIAILDAMLAVLCFSFTVAVLFIKGDEAVLSKLLLDDGSTTTKKANSGVDEKTETIFRWSFFGMVILISFTMHTVQLLMAWTLYGGAAKVKEDKLDAVKSWNRWRSWSIILTVLLFMGLVSFFLLFPHNNSFCWWTAAFFIVQIFFQIGAILYVGKSIREMEDGLNIRSTSQAVDLKILYDL